MQHDVQMVGHYRVAEQSDGEVVGEVEQALLDPFAAVLERAAAVVIDAAQEGAPHAALHAMKGAGSMGGDEQGAGRGHGCQLQLADAYK